MSYVDFEKCQCHMSQLLNISKGQIPRNGLTCGPCPQQLGSYQYMILKIFLIDGLYSVMWYVDIMQ